METSSLQQEKSAKTSRKRLAANQKRSDELDVLIRKIYEDNVSGKLSDKRFEKLSAEYEQEQSDLEQSIEALQTDLNSFEEHSARADKFLELVDKYTDFTELTTPILNEFVEKIIVHERIKGPRYSATQRVDIYLNFIGLVDSPEIKIASASENKCTKRYVAENTSFAALGRYLERQTGQIVSLFAEIENIIGKKLCKSACKYTSYWYPGKNRPISNVIFNAGYDIKEINLKDLNIILKLFKK